jgi:predicted dehydrogenase
MTPVQAALLGLKHPHSLAHLRTLQALPEVDAIVLWDEDEQTLSSVHKEQGAKVEGVYTDLDALLDQEDLFFAIASVRNDLAPDLFVRVLEAGKHLLAEKPIGRTAADTERVLTVAEKTGSALSVCYPNRANPAVMDARRMVSEEILGPLISVEMRMITTQVQFRDPAHWLFRAEHAGGGMLSWLGCHYIDMMRYITGDEIVSVAAETATRSGEDIDVEDVAVLSIRFRSGAVGSLHTGYMLALSGGGYHNSTGYDAYVGINGRAGRIHWSSDGAPHSLTVESVCPNWAGAPRRTFDYALAKSPSYLGVYGEQFVRAFVQSAQDGRPIWASGYDALQVARVIDAAYLSSRTGRRVEVELPVQIDVADSTG